MIHKGLVVLFSLFLVMGLSTSYAAMEPKADCEMMGNGAMMDSEHGYGAVNFAKELDLSKEQTVQVDHLRKLQRDELIQLREQRRRADFDMKTALSKNDIDLNVVDRLKKDIVDVESKLIDNRVNSVVSLKKVLSATQFDKFLDLQIRRHSGPMNEMKGDKMPLARKKAIK